MFGVGLVKATVCVCILLSLWIEVGAWQSKFFSRFNTLSKPTLNVFGKQHLTSQSQQAAISSYRRTSALKFKVSEADVEEEVEDDEDIEFENVGGGSVLQKVSKGLPLVAASLGFAVTPSPAIALRAAGAAAGGVVGLVARNAILSRIKPESGGGDDEGRGGGGGGASIKISPSVTLALDTIKRGPPAGGMDLKSLEQIAKRCRVAPDDLAEFFTHVFAQVVYEAVQSDSEDLTELSEVTDFAVSVGLTPAEIGDGFAIAAVRIGSEVERDSRGFFQIDSPKVLMLQAAKVFFLADKMIGSSQGYYGKRLAVSLSFFTNEELKEVVTRACTDLFRRCVESVLANPDKFTEEEVQTMKEFLFTTSSASALRPATMQNMIMEGLQLTLTNALKDASARHAAIPDYEGLTRAQRILGWNSIEFDKTVETRTMPVFETAARQIVEEVVQHPERVESLSAELQDRIKSLNITPLRARVFLTTLISEQNNGYMSEIDKVYTASQGAIEPAYKIMASYAETHEALEKLVAPVMEGTKIPVPGLPFAEMVRVGMYQMELAKKRGVTEGMFQLNKEQQRIVKKNLALPKVTSWINQCVTESNFKEDAKKAYSKLLDEYGITSEEWQATAVDFYYQEVQKIATTRAVPSNVDMMRLAEMISFLDVSPANVAKVNLELLGDKYVKAVTESMTPTGVITEEYLEGLERLRARLNLSEEDAKNLLGLASRVRIGPVVKDLCDVWKSDADGSKRRDEEMAARKKKGGDPISSMDNVFGYMETGAQKDGGGPNVFMREALNLVDFFVENYFTKNVDVSVLETLPVTAVGVVPEKDLAGMFKHYLITRLSEQDEVLRRRYVEAERVFALVLGINPEGQAKIKESLAYTAYKNMLKNVFRYKEAVDPQDLQQFVVLKESLQLEQTAADRILSEASKGAVLEHAASFIRPKDAQITANEARRLRTQITSLGLDIQKDTGFNEKLVTYMYALEVQDMIENGEEENLKDVQEAYDIPEERAAEIVEAASKRYVSQLLNLALRAAKKYDEVETIKWTKQIAKFATFISDKVDADGNLFSEEDKKRMIQFYEVDLREDAAEGDVHDTEMCDKLRAMVHLTKDYVPPVDGIDGLLGKVKAIKDLTAGVSDEDGKRWAWG